MNHYRLRSHRSLWFAAMLALLPCFACAKSSHPSYTASSMPAPEVAVSGTLATEDSMMIQGVGGVAQGESMGFADHRLATTSVRQDSAVVKTLSVDKKSPSKNNRRGRDADPAPPEKPVTTNPAKEEPPLAPLPTDSPKLQESEPIEKVADSVRQMIYTAQMVVSVFKLPEAGTRIEEMTVQQGGYIQTMTGTTFILRIPASKLRPFMKMIGGFGIVESQSLQAQDVTEEYTDLGSRIRVLKQTQLQLLELLAKARTVDEALHVRQALDQVTMELEQALGRMRMLENLIGFSTLTIQLQERGPYTHVPSANDPFPWVNNLGVEATEWK